MWWLRAATSLIFALVMIAVVSCTSQNAAFDYLRLQVDGQPTLAITKKDVFIRGVVVYFHGVDEDEFALTSDDARRKLTEALVDAGFAVVASRAGGNAFADPATLQNYRELGSMAMQHYRIENVYFLAESMGSIPAVNLLASSLTPVRGLAAIRPALELTGDTQAWPSRAEQQPPIQSVVVDPMAMPAESLMGRNMRLYVSSDDSSSESPQNALAFKDRFESSANISVVTCSGGASDASCVQGDDIIKWFTQLG